VVIGLPDVLDDRATDLGCDRAVVRAGDLGEHGANLGLDVRVQLNSSGPGTTVLQHEEIFASRKADAVNSDWELSPAFAPQMPAYSLRFSERDADREGHRNPYRDGRNALKRRAVEIAEIRR
jgi:hypothetical protein